MKKIRKIIKVCTFIIVCWLIIGVIDFIRVGVYHTKPIFCVGINTADDGGSGNYIGMGYSFFIKGNFMPEDKTSDEYGIVSYQSFIFGREVGRGGIDQRNNYDCG